MKHLAKSRVVSLSVLLLALLAVSVYAYAQCCSSKPGAQAQMAAKPGGCPMMAQGCEMAIGKRMVSQVKPLNQGSVALMMGRCHPTADKPTTPVVIKVTKSGEILDASATVKAVLSGPEGKSATTLTRKAPGIYLAALPLKQGVSQVLMVTVTRNGFAQQAAFTLSGNAGGHAACAMSATHHKYVRGSQCAAGQCKCGPDCKCPAGQCKCGPACKCK